MAKGKNRKKQKQMKEQRKQDQLHPSGKSKYARKAEYLKKNNLRGVEVPEPKPWK